GRNDALTHFKSLLQRQERRGPYPVCVAKKKARTPNPPRKVQAPQRRDTKSASNPLSQVPRWAWLVSAAVIVGVVLVGVILASGGKSTDAKAALLAAGCTFKDVKPLPPKKDPTGASGGYHADVPTLSTPTKGLWSTSPPSAGAHYGQWAVWGFYKTPVNPRQVVHNEEHGGMIIWWGPKVPKSTVDQLEAFYNQQPDGVFGTLYPALGNN